MKTVFKGGKRLGMALSTSLDDWYVGYSPRNSMTTDNFNGASVEGDWDDWVTLAKEILAEDEARKAQPTSAMSFDEARKASVEQYGEAYKKLADL